MSLINNWRLLLVVKRMQLKLIVRFMIQERLDLLLLEIFKKFSKDLT